MMDIDALRAETPGCALRIHLNNAGAALLAQPTLDAMTSHLRLEAEIGGYEPATRAQEGIAAVYAAIAELVGGRSEEVALFDNATHAWNAAFYSAPLGRADRILTGRAEYGSNVLAYWQAAKRTGAEVAVVPRDRHGQMDVAALAAMADERTRLIGASHVPTSGGLVQPAADIGKIARACGALFLLDATQSAGQFPLDVQAIGCDMLNGTGRKFLRGPREPGSCGYAPPRSSGLTQSSRRSDLRPGTGTGAYLDPRRPPVRDLGTQLRQRPGPGRSRAASPRPGPGRDRPARHHAGRPAPRPAQRAARCLHPRPGPDPLRHRHRQGQEPARRRSCGSPGACRGQRHRHRARA